MEVRLIETLTDRPHKFCIECGKTLRFNSDACAHGFCDGCNTADNHRNLAFKLCKRPPCGSV